MDTQDEPFGLIRPSLIKQLKSILEQYPDDGQILKELIQNAEDAGASEVKFLYDEHSYPTATLHHPGLAEYQGPALYAYNDAIFQEADWHGIRLLQDSIKEKDPLKVGRFGLGFKSVLHMTDLPSVISGQHLAAIDPHEKFFTHNDEKTSGKKWHLKDKRDELLRIKDQIVPYIGIFGDLDENLNTALYNGTLFRFPLRNKPSGLSSTIYDPQKMSELLQAFQNDAHYNLVFLKRVQCISLYSRKSFEDTPRLIYQVCLASEETQLINSKRREILQQIKLEEAAPVSVTYPLVVKKAQFHENDEILSTTFRWLVNEYYAGTDGSEQLEELTKELSYVPLVGVAMEVRTTGEMQSGGHLSDRMTNLEEPMGQVFCALPLPVEQKSATGFPVHVNGFFAVGQNRRHLKWRSEGQKLHADKSIQWNHCLLTELLPKAYTDLVREATHMFACSSKLFSLESVYRAVPNLNSVDEKWKIILEPLFNLLLEEAIFFTPSSNGQWISIKEALFDSPLEDYLPIKSLLTRVLISAGVKIVSVPGHVTDALDKFRANQKSVISPYIMRQALVSKPNIYENLETQEKLDLLSYIIDDEKFGELGPIRLLPLDDGTFTNFNVTSDPVYIGCEEHPSALLPGLENRMLSEQIDETLRSKLRRAADEGSTRLQPLGGDTIQTLLPDVIPSSWHGKEMIQWNTEDRSLKLSMTWLSSLWSYLARNNPFDLTVFEGLPILPVSQGEIITMIPLSKPAITILRTSVGRNINNSLCKILKAAGVHVIEEVPGCIQNHPGLENIYIKRPLPEDILDVLYTAGTKSRTAVFAILNNINENERYSILAFLAKLDSDNVAPEKLSFLQDLSVFTCIGPFSKSKFVSLNAGVKATTSHSVLTKHAGKLINASKEPDFAVAKLLGATFISECDILQDIVLPKLERSEIADEDVHNLMRYVFENMSTCIRNDHRIANSLGNTRFVKTVKPPLKKPNELFDPQSSILKKLFLRQDVFPSGWYGKVESLVVLRQMGLCNETNITAKHVADCFNKLEELTDGKSEDAVPKAVAIFLYLSENPEILDKNLEGNVLRDWTLSKSWVPVVVNKPRSWPETLDWFKATALCDAKLVKLDRWTNLVASVSPIIKLSVSQKLADYFGWASPPRVEHVIEQLRIISASYVEREKSKYLSIITDIYQHLSTVTDIYQHGFGGEQCEVGACLSKTGLLNWVWHGDGFTSPGSVVLTGESVDMRPYVFVLPSEMRIYSNFLLRFGMKEQISIEMQLDILSKIKHKYEQRSGNPNDMERDLHLVISILKQIKHKYSDFSEEYKSKVSIPTKIEQSGELRMLPVDDCTYCDAEWLSQGLSQMEFDEEENINLIHPDLPIDTAEMLEVPTLMSRMLHADEFDISSFGQTEPLTNRLKRLLEDYTDGLSIPKELIQNADDAGATEVKFLYDERTNQDSMQYLLSEGMKECQGPSLWVQNNAVFTDNDFNNITRLGGATKDLEGGKIGKFGLGFNAVYNVTDVPSLVSRNFIVIFDPHTSHLGTAIKDKSKPGIKIDISRNRTLLRKLSDQFKPYQGIFGCDVRAESDGTYDGTLFRLPLRTKREAIQSEISTKVYDRNEITELLQILAKGGSSLLLFTQNVCKVTVYHLRESRNAAECEMLISISKSPVKILRELKCTESISPNNADSDTKALIQNSAILKVALMSVTSTKQGDVDSKHKEEFPRSCLVLRTNVQTTESGRDLINKQLSSKDVRHWLLSSCMGNRNSLELATLNNSYVPVAGIATSLIAKGDGFVPAPLIDNTGGGQVFCYLPLPVFSGLPVHLNAHFAIQSNRRSLCEKTDDDKDSFIYEWNEALQKDPVILAYVQMLEKLAEVCDSESCIHFHELWPTINQKYEYFYPAVEAFYNLLLSSVDSYVYCEKGSLATIGNSVFLEKFPDIDDEVVCLIRQTLVLYLDVEFATVLPPKILETIRAIGCETLIKEKLYGLERFYEEVFFPNITALSADIRDPLVSYALDLKHPILNNLLADDSCIPVSPDGNKLKMPGDLIHPQGKVAQLYFPEDGRFPHGERFTTNDCLQVLQQLGMQVDKITWDDLLERSERMKDINSAHRDEGPRLLKQLIYFIEENICKYDQADNCSNRQSATLKSRLCAAPFLPIMPKPPHCLVTWKGDEFDQNDLLSADNMYSEKHKRLISASFPIVDDHTFPKNVRQFLGLLDKEPTVDAVVAQVESTVEIDPAAVRDGAEDAEFRKTWHTLYSFLQDCCSTDIAFRDTLPFLFNNPSFLLIEQQYISPENVAFEVPEKFSPYLYRVPDDLRKQFMQFLKHLGVRDEFDASDYIRSLQSMDEKYKDMPLQNEVLDVAVRLVSYLNETIRKSTVENNQLLAGHDTIYVPNAMGVLMPATSLCFNDCPWISDKHRVDFTHPSIGYAMSDCIGVKRKRQVTLSKHAKIIPFGQSQTLTRSLKQILRNYPLDSGILLEMIQNADDAEATEIHFVLDGRHLPDTYVFGDSWKSLQGPALCVFNNKPFSEPDIEGIQKLGEGSKEHNSSKIGQYGVGFSVMYHLTDVPTLLTRSSDLGESLCVFDPQCRYIPDTSSGQPGMRLIDLHELKTDYHHVFMGYLENVFDGKDATIFRFPLRTEEMAKESEISDKAVSIKGLKRVLDNLQHDLFDILLFTNYLEKISISEVNPTSGNLYKTITVELTASAEDQQKRTEMATSVKEAAQKLRSETYSLTDITRKQITCFFNIKDNKGNKEEWCVSQQLGIADDSKVSDVIHNAYKHKLLALLPRGGVACRVQKYPSIRRKRTKIFCFMPLPVTSSLPIHINGHFALGQDNRRNLWTSEIIDYKMEWNDLLCRTVIAPAYVELLSATRSFGIQVNVSTENSFEITCSKSYIESALKEHEDRFPSFDENWKSLVQAVYSIISENKARVLPFLRPKDTRSMHIEKQTHVLWEVTWLPFNGTGHDKAYFLSPSVNQSQPTSPNLGYLSRHSQSNRNQDQPTDEEILESVLLDSGFKIFCVNAHFAENVKKSELNVDVMSPESVSTFFKSYRSDNPICELGKLPLPLSETPLKTQEGLEVVLKYCFKHEDFKLNLDGIPLLLTQDVQLRVFTKDDPVYHTIYQDLVPECNEQFLHRELRTLFDPETIAQTIVLRELDIKGLADLLLNSSLEDKYNGSDPYIKWDGEHKVPNEKWIKRLWNFLNQYLDKITHKTKFLKTKPTLQRQLVLREMQPLNNWCILPVGFGSELYLGKVNRASDVFNERSVSLDDCYVAEALRNIVPVLRSEERLEVRYTTQDHDGRWIKYLTATLDEPGLILGALHRAIIADTNKKQLAKRSGFELLKYFNKHLETISQVQDAANLLKNLPFYITICDDVIKLTGSVAYTLARNIPTTGLDVFRKKSGIVFLRANKDLESLYTFIDCKPITIHYLYSAFMFKHFEYFSREDVLVHIEYLYETYLKDGACGNDLDQSQKSDILETLKQLEFIENKNGDLVVTPTFYDPYHPLFKVMARQEHLPAAPKEPFTESNWYPFLKKLGMKTEVTDEIYLKFTRMIIQEIDGPSREETQLRSQAMVKYLFGMPEDQRKSISKQIKDIAFIAPVAVPLELSTVCQQHGDQGDRRLSYFAFSDSASQVYAHAVWSTLHILPDWADPGKQLHFTENDKLEMFKELQIHHPPNHKFVLEHLHNLCDVDVLRNSKDNAKIRIDVFRSIYSFFQDHALDKRDAISQLRILPCVLVEDGNKVVLPSQTVINMIPTEEIRPYLYSIPPEFGQFHELFTKLGCCEETPSTEQYRNVLDSVREKTGNDVLNPNELRISLKAMKGVFQCLQRSPSQIKLDSLKLPSKQCKIVEAKKLVFIDKPVFYERVLGRFPFEFLIDLKECGFVSHNIEEVINRLPRDVSPILLSSLVKESLPDTIKRTMCTSGNAGCLTERLKSPEFERALVRIIRHENYRNNASLLDDKMFEIIRRLSLMSIFNVPEVKTHLLYLTSPVEGSEQRKTCFVERIIDANLEIKHYNMYIDKACSSDDVTSDDIVLKQELVIPLAEIINEILCGILGDSVIYLLPVLSCKEDQMQRTLDKLNVRIDTGHMTTMDTVLPPLGCPVRKEHEHMLREGHVQFDFEDFVGYKECEDKPVVYAMIKEKIPSPDDQPFYLVRTSAAEHASIVSAEKLLIFERK